jgi:hypothetical protein
MRRFATTVLATTALLIGGLGLQPASAAGYPPCTITGTAAGETITGTEGNDVICTGGGNDTVNGLGGNDIIIVSGPGIDTINGGSGNDTIDATLGTDSTIDAGAGDDTVYGTPGDDEIAAGDGSDTVDGNAGDDTITGGDGSDNLQGDVGNDTITGDTGDDTVTGGDGNDTLNGSVGDDRLIGGAGADNLNGGDGSDNLEGSAGNDNLFGQSGTDSLSGSSGDDLVAGGQGLDSLNGGEGLNTCDLDSGEILSSTCVYDDAPPVLSVSLLTSSVDVGSSDGLVHFNIGATDATGIKYVSVACVGAGGSVSASSSAYLTDMSSLASNSGVLSHTGTARNFQAEMLVRVPVGSLPGSYECYGAAMDVLDHFSGWMKTNDTLDVSRSGGQWDDAPPVLSVSLLTSSVDVGSSDGLVHFNIGATDATGIKYVSVACVGAGGSVSASSSAYLTDMSSLASNSGVLSHTGTARNFQAEMLVRVPVGSLPGSYECYGAAMDVLDHFSSWIRTDSKLQVFRTPPGQPTAPNAFAFEGNPDRPTEGSLVWEFPDFRGSPELSGYLVQYSTNGTEWQNITGGSTVGRKLDITDLMAGSVYWFRVRGDNGGTAGQNTNFMNLNWSVIVVHTFDPRSPGVPSGLVSSEFSTFGFKLNWLAPKYSGGSGITDFKVETSRDGGASWQSAKTGVSTSNSLTVTGAVPGTTYLVRIAAVNAVGQSEYLTGSVTTLATTASAPRGLSSNNLGTNTVSLGWALPDSNGGSEITDYQVEVTSNGANSWTVIPHNASNSLGFNVTNLLPGRTYQFRVSAVTAAGVGAASNVITVTTLGAVGPNAPATLRVSGVKTNAASLSWSGVVATQKVSNYLVDVSTDGITWISVSKRVSTSTSLALSGLRLGTTYQVRVAAVNSVGTGSYVYGSFTTLATVATSPTVLVSSNVSGSRFTLTWAAPSSNGGAAITDYVVEINGGGLSWAPVSHEVTGDTSITVSGLNPGIKYSVRVKAVNRVGVSKVSSTLSVTTLAVLPSSPVVTLKSVTATGAVLNWVAPANGGAKISDYKVEYSTDGGNTWLTVSKSASTSTSLTLKNLKTKTSYLLRVSAKNSVGYSAPSSGVLATTL